MVSTGFVSTGFVSTGFVSTGFVSTGFVSTGLVSTGFVSTGLISTGLVSTGFVDSTGTTAPLSTTTVQVFTVLPLDTTLTGFAFAESVTFGRMSLPFPSRIAPMTSATERLPKSCFVNVLSVCPSFDTTLITSS